jgi:integrase
MTRKPQAPSYDRYHGDYARVVIERRSIHLGKYDSEESHRKYRELIATWSAGQPLDETPDDAPVSIAEVLAAYLEHARRYYDEHPKSRYHHMRRVVRTVRELYAELPAAQFSPKKLQVVRQVFIDRGNCRRQVNDYTRDVVAVFSWGAEQEMIPGSVVHALREVRSLRRGHTDAPEGKVVRAVQQTVVDATLPFLVSILADLVRLQLVSGCRPGELCSMTPAQIDRSGDVWLYRPGEHKTAHLGHNRVIALGPKAQDILRRYLLRPSDAPCFSPKEALGQHLDQRHEQRDTPMNEGNKPVPTRRKRAIAKVHDRYDVAAYRRAIERACDRAFPAPKGITGKDKRRWQQEHRWTPHRLRHTAGTAVREKFGLDGCQAILGHRNARVSEIYSELSTQKAIEIARSVG